MEFYGSIASVSGSITASLFTGSFKGDGGSLYNLPASGVTGLNLSQIASGNATASISSTGFTVNKSTQIQGDLSVTGSIIATNYIVSSSVTYMTTSFASGSSMFGNDSNDVHQFTGSVAITGSITLNGQAIGTGKLDELTFNIYTGSNQLVLNDLQSATSSLSSSIGSLSSSIALTDVSQSNRLTTIEGNYATTGSNLFKGSQTISGSIIPSVDNTYDLGSSTYQWRDVYISSGSLYIDGTKVLGSTSQELTITTDTGQSIKILEGGSDSIILQSADGDIELKSSGGGDILFDPTNGLISIKGTTQIQDGFKITSSGGTNIVFGDSIIVSGSIELTGNVDGIDLQSFSSSVSASINSLSSGNTSLSSSIATTTSGLSSSIGSLSSSVATTTSGLSSSVGSLSSSVATTTSGLSSSIDSLSSSVATTTSGLSSSIGSLSSSIATTTLNTKNRVDSIETTTGSLNTFSSSINTTIKSKLDSESVISGSAQVIITGTTGYSTFSSSVSTSIGALSSSVATTTSGLSSSIGSLSSSVATTTSELSSSIGSLSSSVATTTSGISTIVTNLSSSVATTTSGLSSSIGSLSSSVATTTSELSSSIGSLSSSVATTTLGTKNRVDSIETKTGSFATTGSNIFQGNQTITGSLYISANLVVQGSSSISYVTSSQLRVDDNIITVNTSNPGARFGGLEVYDSGSANQATGSILWDSVNNRWIYQQSSEATYGGGVLMSGPRSSGSLGSELTLTNNRVAKSVGGDHLNDSNITDTGTLVSINSNTEVTGTLTVTSTITGTLSGNASTATSSSYATTATSSSYATTAGSAGSSTSSTTAATASYVAGANVSGNITGNAATATSSSYATTATSSSYSNNSTSSSYATTASTAGGSATASYVAGANVSGNISGNAATATSSSYATTATSSSYANTSTSSSYTTTAGTANAVAWSNISSIPSGIVSSSTQTIANLPSGTVSGSAQVLNGTTIHSGSFFNGISVVSGSAQIDVMTTTNIARLATTGSNSFSGAQTITTALGLLVQASTEATIRLNNTAVGGNEWRLNSYTNSNLYFQSAAGATNAVYFTAAGGANFSGAIAASNFSGTSSGTNTGDVTETLSTVTSRGATTSTATTFNGGLSSYGAATKFGYTSWAAANTSVQIKNSSGTYGHNTYDTLQIVADDVTTFRMIEYNSGGTNQMIGLTTGDGNSNILSSQNLNLYVNAGPNATSLYMGGGGTLALAFNTSGNAQFVGTVKATEYRIATNGTSNVYNIVDATNTYAGLYSIQAGGGSSGYGGSIVMYGHSHATRPGYVSAGISTGSGGKFTVMSGANNNGTDVFTVDANGTTNLTTTADGGLTINKTSGSSWNYIQFSLSGTRKAYFGLDSNGYATIGSDISQISLGSNTTITGNFIPNANNTYSLGTSSYAWSNIYTNDLHLSNMTKEGGNDVDGTNGNWTIQEGAENLYIINNNNGKKFKIKLEEI